MIKKLSTLLLVVLMSTVVLAQSRPEFVKKTVDVKGDEVVLPQTLNYDKFSVIDNLSAVTGDVLGFTFYDYMTNGALGTKMVRFDDGTIQVVEMAAVDSTAGVTTRGSYYQYWDGTKWFDPATAWVRIESTKKGWGNIGSFEDKTATVVSHVALIFNINVGSPEAPAWSESTIPNSAIISWPKSSAANAGSNLNVYVTGGSSDGLPVPFYRSTDAGTTWDIDYAALADTTSPLWPDYLSSGADEYMVDSRGELVSLVNATTNGNVVLYTSTDQGATFTRKTVYDVSVIDNTLDQIPFDTSFYPGATYKMLGIGYPDGTCDVMIDANNVTHVAWGNYELGYYLDTDTLGAVVRDANGALQRHFFSTDYAPGAGILYWNSTMTGGPIKAAVPTAEMSAPSLYQMARGSSGSYPTTIQAGLDMALIGMPQLGYDAAGKIVMVFGGFKDGDVANLDEATVSPFSHVYVVASGDNGANWTTPVDAFGTITGEDVNFPAIPNNLGDKIDMLVQVDTSPGTWLQQAAHPQNRNIVYHVQIDKPITDVKDGEVAVSDFKLDQNYPNPFNPATLITYSIPSRSAVSLKVYDMLGRLVKTLVNTTQETGSYDVRFDASGLASGLYVYTLEAGSYQVSKKMMLMK